MCYIFAIMPKRLAILAVLLVITGAGFPAPRVTPNPKAGPSKSKTQDTQSQQSATISASAPPQASYSEAFNNNAPEKADKDGWDKAAVFSNYLLVVVGIVGIVAASITLRKLERQTKAGEDAAEAALKQANLLVASERAWMIPKIQHPNLEDVTSPHGKGEGWHLPIQMIFANRGKTPAIAILALLEYSSEMAVNPTGMYWEPDLPITPKYMKTATKYPPGSVYVSEEKPSLIVVIPRDFLLRENAAWMRREKCLCVKGFVEYQDVFGETHFSRFCYAYQITQIGGGFTDEATGKQIFPAEFAKVGPGIYNEIT
jgi:type II secretory pathway pseudopilin PulG